MLLGGLRPRAQFLPPPIHPPWLRPVPSHALGPLSPVTLSPAQRDPRLAPPPLAGRASRAGLDWRGESGRHLAQGSQLEVRQAGLRGRERRLPGGPGSQAWLIPASSGNGPLPSPASFPRRGDT